MRDLNNPINIDNQRNLDTNLSVNPIEDGNTPIDNPNQGYLYVSDIDSSGSYFHCFEADVTSLSSLKAQTGSDSIFQIQLSYGVTKIGNGTWFGSNLIKSGEPFTMINAYSAIDFNYVKGYVMTVDSIKQNNLPMSYVFDIVLTVALTEGDPSQLMKSGGQVFKTDRRVFTETQNVGVYVPPINLLSTIQDAQSIFFWEDTTNLAVSYKLKLRTETDTVNPTTYYVNGNHAEFFGSLETTLSTYGGINTFRITNTGIGCSQPTFNVYSITSGTPPVIILHTDSCGSVETTEWEIVGVDTTVYQPNPSPTDIVNVLVKSVGKKPWRPFDQTSAGTAIDFLGLGCKAYTSGVYSTTGAPDIFTLGIEGISPAIKYNTLAELRELLTFQKLRIHTGIEIQSAGFGMTKPPKLYYDKYPTNTKFVLPPLAPGAYYWSVASVFDCEQKIYSEWSPEELLIVR